MSIVFAYRAYDGLAIDYPFRGYWHPVFDAPDIGILPIDGTLTNRDYPDAGELDARSEPCLITRALTFYDPHRATGKMKIVE